MEQYCLILFNNVNSSDIDAFRHAKTRFAAGSGSVSTMKFFYSYKTDKDIRKIVHEVINSGYQVCIYAVFDEQSLKDGSVVVYYTGLDKEFNETKEFKQSVRSDPGAVGNINDSLMIANLDWEDFAGHNNNEPSEMVTTTYSIWKEIQYHIRNLKHKSTKRSPKKQRV